MSRNTFNKAKRVAISKTVFNNIRFLIEYKNMKICDVEKRAYVQQGYMSRAKGENSECNLAFAYQCSQILKVPLEDLFREDFAKEERIKIKKQRIAELEAELALLKGEE